MLGLLCFNFKNAWESFSKKKKKFNAISKVKFRRKKVCMFVMKVQRFISDCKICYDIRPGATIELTISDKYVVNSIDF